MRRGGLVICWRGGTGQRRLPHCLTACAACLLQEAAAALHAAVEALLAQQGQTGLLFGSGRE